MTKIMILTRSQPGPDEQTRATGVVAEAAVFSDGTAVLHWLTEPRGTEFYPAEDAMRKIRENRGRSHFYPDPPGWQLKCPRCEQVDGMHAEGCAGIAIPRLTDATVKQARRTISGPTITDYLHEHIGEVVTAEQVAAATGASLSGVRVFLREASDRDWAEPVPGGWRIS